MKILHVITSLSSRSGGPTMALKALAAAQARQGDEVLVCTTNADDPNGILQVPANTAIDRDGDGVNTWYHSIRYARSLCFSGNLVEWLDRMVTSTDILHIHGLYRFPPTYAAWRARKSRKPYLIRPHGALDPFLYRQSRYGKWALPQKRSYERLFDLPNLNNAAAIHYTSQMEKERALFLSLRSPSVVIPNGVNWEMYSSLPVRGGFRQRIDLKDETPLVLFLGRINFVKGLNLLIPAFRMLLERFSDAHLALVGPDNEGYASRVRQWCVEQGVLRNVVFVDYLAPDAVKQAYVDADVFVLPSYTENFGMTVVEAMACGCPVVISDQVNIWREIREEKAGLVVSLDSREIAQAICQILGDKNAANEMGRLGRLAAERRYAWPRIVNQLREVYRRVIDENKERKD